MTLKNNKPLIKQESTEMKADSNILMSSEKGRKKTNIVITGDGTYHLVIKNVPVTNKRQSKYQ